MAKQFTYASYMIRLWRDPAAEQQHEPVWIGEIESIQTGKTWQFRSVAALFYLLTQQLNDNSTINQNGVTAL